MFKSYLIRGYSSFIIYHLLYEKSYRKEQLKMVKRNINILLDEQTIQTFRELAREEDKKQNALFKDMLQAYLILNSKSNKKDGE